MRTGLRFLSEKKDEGGFDIREVKEKADGRVQFGGYLMHWGDVATIRDFFGEYTEEFLPGSLDKTFRERGPTGINAIKLLRMHDQRVSQAGKYLSLREESAGAAFDAETIPTDVGKNVAVEIREGVLSAMSIGFNSLTDQHDKERNHYSVQEAMMFEGSPVLWPAYSSGSIDSYRAMEMMPEALSRMLTILESGEELPEQAIGQLLALRSRIGTLLDGPGSTPSEPEETIESAATVNDHANAGQATLARLRLHELEDAS